MDERARTRLEHDEVAWLTTVGPDGQPQSSPVWFLWHDGDVYIASEPAALKVANIAANPRVALHLEGAGASDIVVTMEGSATRTSGVPADRYAAKYATELAHIGMTAADYLARFSVAIRIAPTRWRVFTSL